MKEKCNTLYWQFLFSRHAYTFFTFCLLLLCCICNETYGQVPVVATPKPATLQPSIKFENSKNSPSPKVPNYPCYQPGKSVEQTNMEIIEKDLRQINSAHSSNGSEEKDLRQNLYRMQLTDFIQSNYVKAFDNLKSMLDGSSPLVLKQAVFEVEHAFNNTFTYEEFDSGIQELVKIVSFLKGNSTDNIPLNLSIAKAMADTVTMPLPGKESKSVSYPFTYDFDDPYGDEDYNKQFVSKLLATHSGQCHSMPLLYLILAEEVGAQAYLSFSPNHSFIRFKDKRGQLRNYETTQGKLASNEWVMGSGFVTSTAVKNGIFLDTLNKQQVVASCLNDLAMGYIKMFGMDDTTFISRCTDLSLKYYPVKNAAAYVIRSNMYLSLVIRKMQARGEKDHTKVINDDPEARECWEKHRYLYTMLANKGYKNIPKDKYNQWLNSLQEVKDIKRKQKEPLLQKTIR